MAADRSTTNQHRPAGPDGLNSPIRLVLRITVAVFVAESLFMLALPLLPALLNWGGTGPAWAPAWGTAFRDAILVAVATGPIVYFWALRPHNRERSQTEATQGQSEKALAKGRHRAKLGTWRWSIERDELISCSLEFARIHGVGLDEIHDLMHDYDAHAVDPGDRDRIAAVFARADAEKTGYEVEYRIQWPSGEVRHVLEIGEAVRDGPTFHS